MNIKTEKKKYTPPYMELVDIGRVANLLSSSEIEDEDEDGVDLEDIDGYDDEFG